MLQLLHCEIIKFFHRKNFMFIFAFYFLGILITLYRAILYKFGVYSLIYILDTYKIVLIIPFVINITSEFTQGTISQSIINGISRKKILLSKILLAVYVSLLATLITAVLSLIYNIWVGQPIEMLQIALLCVFFFKWVCFFIFFIFLSFFLKQSLYCVCVWGLAFIAEYLFQNDFSTNHLVIDSILEFSHKILPINSMQILMGWKNNQVSIASLSQIIICSVWAFIWIYFSYACIKKRDFLS